ncbi:MAG TPA: PilZ domain-containing protein [Candidatus Limnocylindria bacterium]|nr:PilZ domain-containing protein [Candidatus Limnocylindria bacterium]
MAVAAAGGLARENRAIRSQTRNQDTFEGETVNLSERGIRFKSPLQFSVGESVEIYLTLPRELTGRSPEEVRCDARVVHVEDEFDAQGMTGVGAEVERFEPLKHSRNWAN